MYNELFYEINELGPTNSHEYLIKTSTDYIDFGKNDELVEALQREIAQLREQLLETQKQLEQNLLSACIKNYNQSLRCNKLKHYTKSQRQNPF